MNMRSPTVSLSLHRSGCGIAEKRATTHDERALDATLRARFEYLLKLCKDFPRDDPTIRYIVEERLPLIVAEYRHMTRCP